VVRAAARERQYVVDGLCGASAVGAAPAPRAPKRKQRAALAVGQSRRDALPVLAPGSLGPLGRHRADEVSSWRGVALLEAHGARLGAAAGPTAIAPAACRELALAPCTAGGPAGPPATTQSDLSARITPAPLRAVGGEGRPAVAAGVRLALSPARSRVVAGRRPCPGCRPCRVQVARVPLPRKFRVAEKSAPIAPEFAAPSRSGLAGGQFGAAVLTLHGDSRECGSPAPGRDAGLPGPRDQLGLLGEISLGTEGAAVGRGGGAPILKE
jgi:hypothetical protein